MTPFVAREFYPHQKESLGQAHIFDKVTRLLYGIRLFVVESTNTRTYLISKVFEILENTHKMGNQIRSIKGLLTFELNYDQEFSMNHLATFVMEVESLIEEAWRRKSLPSGPRIRQVWA